MSELNSTENIGCPACGSHNVKIIVEKENENFDIASGILGGICFGPIGMLCGIGIIGTLSKILCHIF